MNGVGIPYLINMYSSLIRSIIIACRNDLIKPNVKILLFCLQNASLLQCRST